MRKNLTRINAATVAVAAFLTVFVICVAIITKTLAISLFREYAWLTVCLCTAMVYAAFYSFETKTIPLPAIVIAVLWGESIFVSPVATILLFVVLGLTEAIVHSRRILLSFAFFILYRLLDKK